MLPTIACQKLIFWTCNQKWLRIVLSDLGAVSSVVEHYLDTVGVTGSKPVSRTIPQCLYPRKKYRKLLINKRLHSIFDIASNYPIPASCCT